MGGWDADWLESPYNTSDSWLLWLASCKSWLCLDLCLFIGGVVLLVVLILGVFFVKMIELLVDIAEGWGSSFVLKDLGIRLRTLGSLANSNNPEPVSTVRVFFRYFYQSQVI